MKLICERTTFIPGFCVFSLYRNAFRVSTARSPTVISLLPGKAHCACVTSHAVARV